MTYEEALEYAKSYITLKGIPIDSKEATKCIVEALEKQIPKKPRGVRDFGDADISYYYCPTCGQVVYELFDFYCSSCGQKLTDWSEVE